MIKDKDKYELIHSEYEVHECDCQTMSDLRERNKYCLEILKGMFSILEHKYNCCSYFLDKTYIYSYIQDGDWTNYMCKNDACGYKMKIKDATMVSIIRDIWTNPDTQYKEKENLFFYNHFFERVFMYDYNSYIEILIG